MFTCPCCEQYLYEQPVEISMFIPPNIVGIAMGSEGSEVTTEICLTCAKKLFTEALNQMFNKC
jgi:hypothetical protein